MSCSRHGGRQWCAVVEAAAAPFMFEHAARFARELRGFAACGLSVAAHDMLVAEAADAAAAAAAPLPALERGAEGFGAAQGRIQCMTLQMHAHLRTCLSNCKALLPCRRQRRCVIT